MISVSPSTFAVANGQVRPKSHLARGYVALNKSYVARNVVFESLEMLSYVARNFIVVNNILTSFSRLFRFIKSERTRYITHLYLLFRVSIA